MVPSYVCTERLQNKLYFRNTMRNQLQTVSWGLTSSFQAAIVWNVFHIFRWIRLSQGFFGEQWIYTYGDRWHSKNHFFIIREEAQLNVHAHIKTHKRKVFEDILPKGHSFVIAASGNLDGNVHTNMAWKSIRYNIKTSTKGIQISLYNIKL
jgi:hypothetical protein